MDVRAVLFSRFYHCRSMSEARKLFRPFYVSRMLISMLAWAAYGLTGHAVAADPDVLDLWHVPLILSLPIWFIGYWIIRNRLACLRVMLDRAAGTSSTGRIFRAADGCWMVGVLLLCISLFSLACSNH